MTQEAFKLQMDRLKGVYGERAYPEERLRLVFNAVKKMPDAWMENTANHFIGDLKQAPMLKDFVGEIEDSKRRDREYTTGGISNPVTVLKKVAVNARNREFTSACIKLLSDRKKYNTEQWEEACGLLDEAAKLFESKSECFSCSNSGYVIQEKDGIRTVYRCRCQVGSRALGTIFSPPDRDGSRTEHSIPIAGMQ